MKTEIKSKVELQKVLMLGAVNENDPSSGWWNANDLTDVLRGECAIRGFESINHATVERNIRLFRESKYALKVEKKQVSRHTWIYKISHDNGEG